MLGDYCKRLEDEVKKIEGFERELPLSILILKDGMIKRYSSLLGFFFVDLFVFLIFS